VRNPTPGEKSIDEALNERVAAGLALIAAKRPDFAGRWLFVDVATQQLLILENRQVTRSWSISTAAAGLDNRQDSGGTPPGLHLIHRKIGAGAEQDMIFESRELTGILWRRPAAGEKDPTEDRDLILTRVLTLDGQ
jgi:hypothetical protein